VTSLLRQLLEARSALQVPPDGFRLLGDAEARSVASEAKAAFVEDACAVWWWEHFRQIATTAQTEQGWKLLPELVPCSTESVWLITEEDDAGNHQVLETTAVWASRILGECYAFEYYLVAKDLSWLVGENHHDVVFAIGKDVEQKLRQHAV
jgi:hypothetical protein